MTKEIDISNPDKSISQILREARLQKGYKLSDIATALNIEEAFLKAFEAGQLGRLPHQTYALGFLRSYAQYLKLDPFQTVDRFKKDYHIPNDEALHVPSSEELKIMSFFDSNSKSLIKPLGSKTIISLAMTFLILFLGYKILVSVRNHLPKEEVQTDIYDVSEAPQSSGV